MVIAIGLVFIMVTPLVISAVMNWAGGSMPVEEEEEALYLGEVPDWVKMPMDDLPYIFDPRMDVDPQGFVHIAAMGARVSLGENATGVDENATAVDVLWYLKLNTAGDVVAGPYPVNGTNYGLWHQEIVADSQGRANIVWTTEVPDVGSQVAFCRIGADGNISIPRTLVSTEAFRSIRPNVNVDADDNVHIVFTESHTGEETPGRIFRWEMHYSKVGASGSIEVMDMKWMDYHMHNGGFGDVAIDSRGNIHVAYVRSSPLALNQEVHYRTFNNDGVWLGTDHRLTHIRSSGAYPKLSIDTDDNLHFAWYDDSMSQDMGYGVWYARLGPLGMVHQRPIEVTNETSVANLFYMNSVNIETTRSNDIVISWHGRGKMYMQTWTPNDMVRKDGIKYATSVNGEIALDGNDRIHAVYLRAFPYAGIGWRQVDHSVVG